MIQTELWANLPIRGRAQRMRARSWTTLTFAGTRESHHEPSLTLRHCLRSVWPGDAQSSILPCNAKFEC